MKKLCLSKCVHAVFVSYINICVQLMYIDTHGYETNDGVTNRKLYLLATGKWQHSTVSIPFIPRPSLSKAATVHFFLRIRTKELSISAESRMF